MMSAGSLAASMMLSIARCDILSAADTAIAVMAGMEATAWKCGALALADRKNCFWMA